jgi:segregation and condensation protein B
MTDPESDPHLQLAQAAAAQLGGVEWSLDAEPVWEEADAAGPEPDAAPSPVTGVPEPAKLGNILPAENLPDPPGPMKILEAMLFVGGGPLTAEEACAVIRGLSPAEFRNLIEGLARKYRLQNRPYSVVPRDGGFEMELKPRFRSLKDRAGPREVELSQPALDALSLVAYRQPITKTELDALAGTDTGSPLKLLARLGLVAVQQRATGETGSAYGTTPKFLATFGLSSLDDLPRLGDVGE